MDILLIKKLPRELIDLIFKFTPHKMLLQLNKKYYEYYHSILYNNLNKSIMESYVRFIIKKKMNYPFQNLYNENIFVWKTKKTQFNNKKGKYLSHLNSLCIQYKSQKCREILMNK